MNDSSKINLNDIFLPPNLVSLTRILITPFVGYYLWLGTNEAALICFLLLVVAAVTDFLDGFLARRLNQITRLGLILDPLADKILTIVLIIELIFFRAFPIWLAIVILARDVVIMIIASRLVKKRDMIPSSNLTGKYYFASIAFLLISYVIRFDFGIRLFQYIVIVLLLLSSVNYGRMLWKLNKGGTIDTFKDKTTYKIGRFGLSAIILILYLYQLYTDNPF
jgi:CDP-diacylglycerol--glycerol-3-phosphate 3-phosphatidyltransferase